MKKVLALCTIALAATFAVACSGDSGSTPVAPDTASLAAPAAGSGITSVSAEARSNDYWNICHYNPDWETDGGYEWTIVQVNNTARYEGHCGYKQNRNHGDFDATGLNSCSVCAVAIGGFDPGDDCSACLPS